LWTTFFGGANIADFNSLVVEVASIATTTVVGFTCSSNASFRSGFGAWVSKTLYFGNSQWALSNGKAEETSNNT